MDKQTQTLWRDIVEKTLSYHGLRNKGFTYKIGDPARINQSTSSFIVPFNIEPSNENHLSSLRSLLEKTGITLRTQDDSDYGVRLYYNYALVTEEAEAKRLSKMAEEKFKNEHKFDLLEIVALVVFLLLILYVLFLS